MAKFSVKAPVEHDQKLYLPKGVVASASAGNGLDIPVDCSGVIELDEAQARALRQGQVEPVSLPSEARPDSKRTRR
jgi:hypothetical protein